MIAIFKIIWGLLKLKALPVLIAADNIKNWIWHEHRAALIKFLVALAVLLPWVLLARSCAQTDVVKANATAERNRLIADHDAKLQQIKLEQTKLALVAAETARVKTKSLQQKVDLANEQLAVKRSEIDAVANDLERAQRLLSKTLSANRERLSSDPSAAASDTGAESELLSECAERYASVAEAADRHAADSAALIEAWPSND